MTPEAQVQSFRVAVRIGDVPIQLPLLPLALPAADQLLVMPLCVSETDRSCRSATRPPVGPVRGSAGSIEPRRVLANGDTAPRLAKPPPVTSPRSNCC